MPIILTFALSLSQLRRLRLYDGIYETVRNEPFDVHFHDWNPPEPARASRRDRTLTPLRPLCSARVRSGLRTAQSRGASVGRLTPFTPLLPPFR